MNHFRNYDSSAPQVVKFAWERVLIPDSTAGRPDEMQDGYWPSRNPEDAGYLGAGHTNKQYKTAQAQAKARMAAFERGDWGYVGVIARAQVSIPIGGTSFATYTLDSPGVWSVEDDSGAYLDELFEEQKSALESDLETLARHVLAPVLAAGESLRVTSARFEDDSDLDAAKAAFDAATTGKANYTTPYAVVDTRENNGGGAVIACFATMAGAESFLATSATVDPDALLAGEYRIDGPTTAPDLATLAGAVVDAWEAPTGSEGVTVASTMAPAIEALRRALASGEA